MWCDVKTNPIFSVLIRCFAKLSSWGRNHKTYNCVNYLVYVLQMKNAFVFFDLFSPNFKVIEELLKQWLKRFMFWVTWFLGKRCVKWCLKCNNKLVFEFLIVGFWLVWFCVGKIGVCEEKYLTYKRDMISNKAWEFCTGKMLRESIVYFPSSLAV